MAVTCSIVSYTVRYNKAQGTLTDFVGCLGHQNVQMVYLGVLSVVSLTFLCSSVPR